jgi:hypothetical protein
MPTMQAPTGPKVWQLSVSMWNDGAKWPHANIATSIPETITVAGRLFQKPNKKASVVTTFAKLPKGATRLGTYVFVANKKDVDATMLEDAALFQAKKDGANGIVEKERGFEARNNYKGSSAGLGMALSILGSIGGNMTGFGPNGGFQSGSYVSDRDVFIFLAVDVVEVP